MLGASMAHVKAMCRTMKYCIELAMQGLCESPIVNGMEIPEFVIMDHSDSDYVKDACPAGLIFLIGSSTSRCFATIQIVDDMVYEYGRWRSEMTERKSSNRRELNNLLETLECVVITHNLEGSEIFIYRDNSTAEAAHLKGTSKSKTLFELVLHLKKLELNSGMILHVVQVSGRHMNDQGTDSLSRANHIKGIAPLSDKTRATSLGVV
jgi:hypothetical protein